VITESFINSCFVLTLNKKAKIKKTKALKRDILEIIDFYEAKKELDIPLAVKNKLDCLKKVCEMMIDDKTIDNVVDSLSFSEKYKEFKDFLDLKTSEEIKEPAFQDIVKQVRLRKKIINIFSNYDELSKLLENIKTGNFECVDDVVEEYEHTIRVLYSNMMESNRSIMIEASSSLDLVKDDYDHVVDLIKKKYDKSSAIPTGFKLFDNRILPGGLEPSRLYIIGGGSGAGKSTLMNNIIYRSATSPPNPFSKRKVIPGKINRVYIYVTLENTIEEALMRTYMPMFDKTSTDMLQDITEGIDIKTKIMEEFAKNGSTIIMKYFPGMSISPLDLVGVVDDAIEEYGKESICGLFIDYLDLLKTDMKYDLYRLELGYITLSLKTFAVQYNIPVVTASQLGRKAYSISGSKELEVDMISESIKKVEHADFIMLMAKDRNQKGVIYGRVGKNRSGEPDMDIEFQADLSRYKFINANIPKNKDKPDASSKTALFGGMEMI
jgi:replicative DNA helicase